MTTLATIISFCVGLFIWLISQNVGAETVACSSTGDFVVLLHGMGRTSLSMKRMEHFLTEHGYNVINVTYRSRRFSVDELAEKHLKHLLESRVIDDGRKVHFVTHSLGGIIVRQYLSKHKIKNLGRVVMLAPPNHGSEIIDRLRANSITRNFLGASARELGTGADGLPTKLGPVQFPCGVIAGDRSLNPLLSSLLPCPNDGKVTVASARVDGMQGFLVVHGTHTWLMCKQSVMNQTLSFLQSGYFSEPH